jgi:hypothetical protein
MGVRASTNARGAGDVAPQHRDLVPEHEDLGVLGRLAAAQQYEPADELKQIREKA